ncbi:MAG TPA: hypothetical protein PKX40_05455 [Spirochaetota bacterium]|nr:hypothetical protein [Spirochaetota bacterium]
MTTTRIFAILGYKTDRIFAGVKPLLEHSIYAAWRSYKQGYDDRRRSIGGNNFGVGGFFQYNWFRIFSTRVFFHPSYFFYRLPLLTPNEHKYVNVPHRHWQLKPGIEVLLSDVKDKSMERVKHGYMVRLEYNYARRVGYGTWYDYDRLFFREKLGNTWVPPTGHTEGIWYKSSIRNTHRFYFNAGGYYNFKGDYNILLDLYGGYFIGVDRNNTEQIGGYPQDYGVMPGYYSPYFYHHFYVISRLQAGFPIPFWDARIQPGFNILYMPTRNEVIGMGRGAIWNRWLVRNYSRNFYTSLSCSFSLLLGNLLPLFIDYAYGFEAERARSAAGLYMGRTSRGCHELQILVLMAFEKNETPR